LLDEFIAYRKEIREATTDFTINRVTEEIIRLEKQLREEEEKIGAFLENNNLVLLIQKDNTAAAYLQQLRGKKSALETELALLDLLDIDADIERRSRLEMTGARPLGSMGAMGSAGAASSVGSGASTRAPGAYNAPREVTAQVADVISYSLGDSEREYLKSKRNISLLQSERSDLLRNLRSKHPRVLEVDEMIRKEYGLQSMYKNQSLVEGKRRKEGIKLQIENLQNEMAKWEKEALDTSARLGQHGRLTSVKERIEKRYNEYLTMMQEIDTNQNIQQDYISIMERASNAVVREPDFLKPIIMGLLLGSLGGLGVILMFDKLDDRMNSFSEFQSHFGEDVLGQIPDQNFRGESPLLTVNDERHLYAEAFRNLRSSLLFKDWQGQTPKLIAITSSVPNEGKTTIAANVAFTMANSGAKVLLVDADLRRGGMNELYGLPSSPGMSEVLSGSDSWLDCIHQAGNQNLFFLPRGKALEQKVRESFDFVLFDTAPVLVADDTASFAPKVDTTLFVVRMFSTMARLASKALGQLYDRQVNIGGVVLSRTSTSLKEYSYYNYANYYSAKAIDPAGNLIGAPDSKAVEVGEGNGTESASKKVVKKA